MPSKSIIKRVFSQRFLVFFIAILVLFSILVLLDELEDTVDVQQADRAAAPPQVTVVTTLLEAVDIRVSAYSEVTPQWQLELKTEIGGKVKFISDKVSSGAQLRAGDLLFEIDPTRYLAEFAAAQYELRQRQLELQRAQYESHVASEQFKAMGKQAPNELALNIPQVEIAKAAVNSAKANIKLARYNLEQTKVYAPFNGYLLSHQLSPGKMLLAGEGVAQMQGDDRFEFALRLSKSQWQQLHHPLAGQNVALYSESGIYVGDAIVDSAGGYLDLATRHYLVHLIAASSQVETVAGEYLQARFKGKVVNNVLTLPASAITPEGNFWWVDDSDQLNRSPAIILDRQDDSVVVKVTDFTRTHYAVVVTPLSRYLPKQKVTPIERNPSQQPTRRQNTASSGAAL